MHSFYPVFARRSREKIDTSCVKGGKSHEKVRISDRNFRDAGAERL